MPDTATIETEPTPTVVAKKPEFSQLESQPGPVQTGSLDSFRDVPITVTAKLGQTILPISDILKLGPGSVIELDESITQPIELTVRGVAFATAEVVVVDDHFAVRIKNLLPPRGGKPEA